MKNKQSTRWFSSKQEQYVAKQLGGIVQPNSGAAHHTAGDVIIPETMVIECKTTTKSGAKSWTIKQEWLDQNEKRAFRSDATTFSPSDLNRSIW